MNPLLQLRAHDQSIWLDYIRRDLLASGGLERLVREDGLRGVTSNPTIFEKAIAGSADYDGAIRRLLAGARDLDAQGLYERLAIDDIQRAADILRSVYDETDGADGFVNLEVSPRLAHDTVRTIDEARRLWAAVARPNLLIKVPGTRAGLPAIETLIGEGINVNVTLMFSLTHYEAVAQAYLRGLRRHPQLRRVASVASFFVSRVDTAVDKALDAIGTPEALALRGTLAVANARMTYARFREIFHGEAFADLRRRGARPQRPLWASTGTKNPAYSDVLYVEELIGPETVNTMPPATMDAFRDHGRVRGDTLLGNARATTEAFERLRAVGIDFDRVAETLQTEGVAAFAASSDALLAALEAKRAVVLARITEAVRG
jgi:transaldolase